jgi:hypothetical protein
LEAAIRARDLQQWKIVSIENGYPIGFQCVQCFVRSIHTHVPLAIYVIAFTCVGFLAFVTVEIQQGAQDADGNACFQSNLELIRPFVHVPDHACDVTSHRVFAQANAGAKGPIHLVEGGVCCLLHRSLQIGIAACFLSVFTH